MSKIKHALISVSDKTGIVEFARQLVALEVTILSTGGTARLLGEHAIEVIDIADYIEFPEIMDGRVKTLHPKIYGALLARHGIDDAVMAEHKIKAIDLLVVNLYPFATVVEKTSCTLSDAIENIDIGGTAMLRAAAKNYAHVGVIVDNSDYGKIITELHANHSTLTEQSRFRLAQKAFAHTASYDANISNYLGALSETGEVLDYPLTFSSQFQKHQDLRYGENPHQTAAFYIQPNPPSGTLASAKQLQGKPLSYNNIVDADVALECVLSYQQPACVIVKHANPCGVALGEDSLQAYEKAYQADSISAFGGVIAFNLPLDRAVAKAITERQFAELVIAPGIEPEAMDIFSAKANMRIMETGNRTQNIEQLNMKRISAGLLVQDSDHDLPLREAVKIVTKRAPTTQEMDDLMFAWQVVRHVKSNAIVYAHDKQTVGIGAGQMSRIYSARIAVLKAADEGLEIKGSVMASDAFLPFSDVVDLAVKEGVVAIIQPGGSIRDDEVIAAADAAGIAMVFTNIRHFLH